MIANELCSDPPSQNRYRPREEISYETSPRKKRKIEPDNDYVSDDDRVSVMASDEFEEAESIRSTWSCYWLDQFLTLALNILILSIFYISMDLSTNYFAHFSGC